MSSSWLAVLLWGAGVLAALPGCQRMADRMGLELKRERSGRWKLVSVQPGRRLENAVASENPDERREGVVWLSHRDRCSLEAVVQLLSLALKQDPDPTVRSAAARGLGRSLHPGAVEPLIAALEDGNEFVRLEAANGLAWKNDDAVKRALLVRLGKDSSPQVRAAAARGLANYQQKRVVEALVGALDDRDFAVVYHAEQSLIHLTGHTHEYEAGAWARWLASLGPDGDPFAQAGRVPPSLQQPHQPLARRMRQAFGRMWFWWQADAKPPE